LIIDFNLGIIFIGANPKNLGKKIPKKIAPIIILSYSER
jgi:hypothetical protein